MSSQLRMTMYAALATITTSTCLTAVLSGGAWVVPVIGGIVLVAASCALIRASPLPSAFEPITAAVAVLLWITVLDARHQARLGFIPGRTAFRHLSRVVQHGFDEIHAQPAPAPAHHGLVMLTVVGVAAIALIVDLMVVTLRRAALAGLPLLALFTVCAATGKHGVNLIWFVVAAVGYLTLLYADNREKVTRWGAAVGTGSRARPASAWSTDPSAGLAPASLGRRVGAMAITLGVLVPFLIPGLHNGIDSHVSGSGNGSGGGGNVTIEDPIVSVASDLQNPTNTPVIDYRTTTSHPGYLRLTSLDRFDGKSFSSNELSAAANQVASSTLPVVPPEGKQVATSYVMAPNLELHWLPLQATTLGVSVRNPWRFDPASSTVFSATNTTRGLRYTSTSVPNQPTANQVSHAAQLGLTAALTNDLVLPKDISPKVKKLTTEITAKAGNNPYLKAVAIQSFFTTTGGFVYDTKIPKATGPDPLAHFLLDTRRGFCQQFATSMAVMARLSGIPSRVAVGFTPGTEHKDGTWEVTTHDAHAWPELYFEGYGWLAFEPTPRADGQTITPAYTTDLGGKGTTAHHPATTHPKKPGAPTPRKRPEPGSSTTGASSNSGTHGPGDYAGILGIVLAALVLLALMIPGVGRVITRRRRNRAMRDPAQAAGAAWAELRDCAVDLRAPWDDGRTPRQLAASLAAGLEPPGVGHPTPVGEALDRLARDEERFRYARAAQPVGPAPQRDLAVVRDALLERCTRWQRLTAVVMPRSMTAVARTYVGRLGAWRDRTTASITATLRRTRLPGRS